MSTITNTNWKGFYFDGRTPQRQQVTVLLNSAGVHITLGSGQTLWWLFERLRVAQGYHPGEPVRLETVVDIPEALIVEDQRFLQEFLAYAPSRGDLASSATTRISGSAPMILGSIALAAGLLFALWRWGIPAFAEVVASRVPASWEDSLGKSVTEMFAPADMRCEEVEGLKKIEDIIARMRGPASSSPPIKLAVTKYPMVNAFAAPGGYVVVFRGLLEQTENAEDLAGVLAHEIQHVEQRHATRGIVRQLSISSLLALMVGQDSGVGSMMNAAATLGAMKYQREDEESADAEGVRMLQRAGIDANGLWRMLDRMNGEREEDAGAFEYLSSHPATTARVRRLQELAAQGGAQTTPLLDGYDWHTVAFMCGEREESEEGSSAIEGE